MWIIYIQDVLWTIASETYISIISKISFLAESIILMVTVEVAICKMFYKVLEITVLEHTTVNIIFCLLYHQF